IHHPLTQYAASISPDLENDAEKNFAYIEQQLDYLKKRMIKKMESNHNLQLGHFRELENMLGPNGLLPDSVWNPVLVLNQYGSQFIKELLENDHLSFEQNHYMVWLNK